MAVRIISAVVAIPLLLFFIICGGLPLRAAVLVLSLVGMGELYKAVSGKFKAVHFVGFALEVVYAFCMSKIHILGVDDFGFDLYWLLIFFGAIVAAMLAVLLVLVFRHKTNNIHDGAITIFGFLYVGVLLSLICEIRDCELAFAWLPFIFAFGSDTGAYFIGSKFGKHKLCPELSPKKSVEGAVGGVVTVAIMTVIYLLVCSKMLPSFAEFASAEGIAVFVVFSVIGAVLSQIGDLAASSIKRFTGIKDYGKIMPGHGGVLDRFDSVLFTLPVVFAAMVFVIYL